MLISSASTNRKEYACYVNPDGLVVTVFCIDLCKTGTYLQSVNSRNPDLTVRAAPAGKAGGCVFPCLVGTQQSPALPGKQPLERQSTPGTCPARGSVEELSSHPAHTPAWGFFLALEN